MRCLLVSTCRSLGKEDHQIQTTPEQTAGRTRTRNRCWSCFLSLAFCFLIFWESCLKTESGSVLLECFVKRNFVYCSSTLVWVSSFPAKLKNYLFAQPKCYPQNGRAEEKKRMKRLEKIFLLEISMESLMVCLYPDMYRQTEAPFNNQPQIWNVLIQRSTGPCLGLSDHWVILGHD